MSQPKNVQILWQANPKVVRLSDPTEVGLSDHPQTAQFDPWKAGLNIRCDILTHNSALDKNLATLCLAWGLVGQYTKHYKQMVLLKNDTVLPERTPPTHGSAVLVP